MIATCAKAHVAPDWDCICGIYAYKEPYRMSFKNDIFYRPREWAVAVGTVNLWGHCVEAKRGFPG
jgi:hypothetical protein